MNWDFEGETERKTDPAVRRKRLKNRGNRGKRYTEGWIEFAHKKIAKQVAAAFNCTPIGAFVSLVVGERGNSTGV